MKLRKSLTVAVAVSAAVVLAGCTGGSVGGSGDSTPAAKGPISGTITFQTWSLKTEKFIPYFNALIKAFEKKNPKVTVNWVDQPSAGYQDKILQQAESGQLPDVINLPPNYAYSLAKAGQLVDLKKAAPSVLGDYVAGGVGAYGYDGVTGVYGFPWYLGTDLNYWNTDLLKKAGVTTPPKDFDAMVAAAKTLAASPEKTPLISTVPDATFLMQMTGGKNVQQAAFSNGKFHFDTPATEKIVQDYADLYKAGAVLPGALTASAAANTNVNNFYQGGVAWTTAGPGFIGNNLSTNAPKLVAGIQATPAFGTPPLNVQGISVAKDSKHQAAALAFAEFVTNNENQVNFVKIAQGFFPGTKAGNADPTAFADKSTVEQQNAATKLAAAEMETAQVPTTPQFTQAMDTYSFQQIALAVQGQITPKAALKAITDYANQNLAG